MQILLLGGVCARGCIIHVRAGNVMVMPLANENPLESFQGILCQQRESVINMVRSRLRVIKLGLLFRFICWFADKVFPRVWGYLAEEARHSWGRLAVEADPSRAFPIVARREHLTVWP